MINRNTSISDLIAYNHYLELVLERYELTSHPGDRILSVACKDDHIHEEFLLEVLRIFDHPGTFSAARLRPFPVEAIMDYIQRTHQYYLNKRLPEIEQNLEVICNRYKSRYPVLGILPLTFAGFMAKITTHIQLEEGRLFPYITELVQAARSGIELEFPEEWVSDYSIEDFIRAHTDGPEGLLAEIREVLFKYHPRISGLVSFNILLNQLEAFETDLYLHGLIEDEVLVPKALGFERQVFHFS